MALVGCSLRPGGPQVYALHMRDYPFAVNCQFADEHIVRIVDFRKQSLSNLDSHPSGYGSMERCPPAGSRDGRGEVRKTAVDSRVIVPT